ncbi:MAG: hypothetical protein HC840_01345 [Leptolyngbyaceae cyanobacterium RM2_2_4]|nr:hypothetical protein [Leptolyngbyaceae cyanobacterium RM2_2_4]
MKYIFYGDLPIRGKKEVFRKALAEADEDEEEVFIAEVPKDKIQTIRSLVHAVAAETPRRRIVMKVRSGELEGLMVVSEGKKEKEAGKEAKK